MHGSSTRERTASIETKSRWLDRKWREKHIETSLNQLQVKSGNTGAGVTGGVAATRSSQQPGCAELPSTSSNVGTRCTLLFGRVHGFL